MKRIRVVLHFEEGTWWAESPDIEGLTVVAETFSELHRMVRDAVTFHFDTSECFELAESLADAASARDVSWVSRTGGTHERQVQPQAPRTSRPVRAIA